MYVLYVRMQSAIIITLLYSYDKDSMDCDLNHVLAAAYMAHLNHHKRNLLRCRLWLTRSASTDETPYNWEHDLARQVYFLYCVKDIARTAIILCITSVLLQQFSLCIYNGSSKALDNVILMCRPRN
jgi:hypothetical protein